METNQNETINAFCDICDSEQNGTKSQLENSGWFLGTREEFCPNCNS